MQLVRRDTRVSVVDMTFAIWVLTPALLFHGTLLNGDGDLARHIVTGTHILGHGPRFGDPFSFTKAGEPFLAYEWLSQSIYALTHNAFGLPGVVVLASVLLACTFALVTAYVRRTSGDPWLAFVTGNVAAVLTYPHWLARPHLFSFVALPLLLHLLTARRVLLLAPLFALWCNLHPGFLYGLVMVVVWCVGQLFEELRKGTFEKRRLAVLASPIVVAAVATLANPFGWGLHAHAVSLLGSDVVRVVHEFMPLVVQSTYGVIFLTACGLLVLGLAASREWVGWHVLLVFGAAFVAALAGRRYAPLLAVFALPLMATALAPVVRGLPAWFLGRMRAEFRKSDTRQWRAGAVALVALLAIAAADTRVAAVTILPGEFSDRVFPGAAIRTARNQQIEGRLLSEYMWGGYVLYAWPGQRVFIDSMADFFGDELVTEYLMLRNARSDWEESLATHDISVVLLNPRAPLLKILKDRDNWRVQHEDSTAVLMVRTRNGAVAANRTHEQDP